MLKKEGESERARGEERGGRDGKGRFCRVEGEKRTTKGKAIQSEGDKGEEVKKEGREVVTVKGREGRKGKEGR